MKGNVKKVVASFLFLVILGFSFFKLNQLFLYKNFYNHVWPTTNCYANFYRMKKNSVDVLFFGSSVAICAFSPQELYNKYKITSYNLGCEQQNLVISYYWLLEALKYQNPKVVVIEPSYILRGGSNPLPTSEGLVRKPIDPMKLSKNKLNVVKDICHFDLNQRAISYLIPTIRFHNRWKYLNEDDFSYNKMINHENLMGATLVNVGNKQKYTPFSVGSKDSKANVNETQKEYLEKIIDVCKKNQITILLCTPPIFESIEWHNAILEFAEDQNVHFLDFNEEYLYNAIEYDTEKYNENSHALRIGAAKITNYIGKILIEDFGLLGHNDEQYTKTNAYFQRVNENFDLTEIIDINTYLEKINRERYSIFISIKDEASKGLSDNVLKKLSALGLCKSLKGYYRSSYYAVISNGKVLKEEFGDKPLTYSGSIRNGKTIYKIESAGLPFGNISQIIIDNINYSKNSCGLNIVVYDDEQKKVIDSVCFDTCDKEMKAFR